jgi:hypothetical protein
VSEEELLVQGAALALFNRLSAQSGALYQLPMGWTFLRSGLRLWLLWDQELPLVRWREPLVRWVFWADEGVVVSKGMNVPAYAHDFCAHHRLWLNTEVEIDMPVICLQHVTGGEAYSAFRDLPPPLMLPTFVGKQDITTITAYPGPSLPYDSVVVFATLFEYISTYEGELKGAGTKGADSSGAERVRAFIDAIPHYQNWETLIPAIFGVSRRDFEAGWNAFLQERYAIAP